MWNFQGKLAPHMPQSPANPPKTHPIPPQSPANPPPNPPLLKAVLRTTSTLASHTYTSFGGRAGLSQLSRRSPVRSISLAIRDGSAQQRPSTSKVSLISRHEFNFLECLCPATKPRLQTGWVCGRRSRRRHKAQAQIKLWDKGRQRRREVIQELSQAA